MNPIDYTHRLRRTATFSWLGALALVYALAALGVLPFHPALPWLALVLGLLPILLYLRRHKPSCPDCGGRLRISAGFPRIVFRCARCGKEHDTRIHADY